MVTIVSTYCFKVIYDSFQNYQRCTHPNNAKDQTIIIYTCKCRHIGYEPAGLTVHPPPQNDRGWVHFFRMGV